ncbi:hypothetical protein M514_20778 [Trichuris suis]|uniref:Integrase catalytic domain-containing protein n=1 Tax=Trichuris suis TaxID=68888 RepID=A0A085NBR6_9BILA|nr:hypothetical protein M514_20778 [Trichuris suis]
MNEHDCEKPICETCFKGKMTAFPFPKGETKANKPMELIHSELCGPMPVETPSGHRYFLTLVDDHSRFTVVHLLKSKDEVFDAIKNYIAKMGNRFSRKPMIFRSDNGREHVTKSLETHFKLQGIEHQLTIPYTPQQNGVAERKNRFLAEMVRCMLSDARLPIRFWGEAVLTAAYLQNRLPSRSIPKTPFEHFYGHRPDVSHLRVFGSKAYSFVPTERRRKLSEKAIEGVIIGYGNTVKGYRILDPKTARVWYSRSVRIIEGPMQPWLDQMKHRQISHSKGSPQTMVNMDEWKDRPEDSSSKFFPPKEGIDGKHEQSSDKASDGSTLAPNVGLRQSERLAAKDERRVRRRFCEDYI